MTKVLRTMGQLLSTLISIALTKNDTEVFTEGLSFEKFREGISGAVIVFATSEVTNLITNGGESDPFSRLSHRAYVHTDACTCTCMDHEQNIDRKQGLESLALQWNSIKLAAEAFEFLSRIGRFHELFGRQSVAGKLVENARSFFHLSRRRSVP